MLCGLLTSAARDRFARGKSRVHSRNEQPGITSREARSADMGPQTASRPITLSERADELEERMMHELDAKIATKSLLFELADGKRDMVGGAALMAQNPGKYFLMGDDPRLPKMPDKPTLLDFFKYRFSSSTNHLLQSATLALKAGHDEKVVLACLLHDIGV